MTETMEYNGKQISVITVFEKDGWTWSFTIDSGPTRKSRYGPLRYQDLALAEALAAARAEIDTEGLDR
ncbi:MAG: hypothetical protein ABIN08_17105 [Caldimonas sp.]